MANKSKPPFQLEEHLNDWVKSKFQSLMLKSQVDFYTESAIPNYLKEALKGRAKTAKKTNFGKPDFSLDKYKIPVVIENKLGIKKLVSHTKDGVKFDEKAVSNFAVNGALYYATGMIASGKYHEAIAVGIAGDSEKNLELKVYYVYGSGEQSYKQLNDVSTLDFLENEQTFNALYDDAVLTDEEKHNILITSQAALQKYAKSLNKLMHNHNITAPQRVLYVSGMLLSMQDVVEDGQKIQDGLFPDDLKGIQSETSRDGIKLQNQITEFLIARKIPIDKRQLMLSSFGEISKDKQRDEKTELDKEVSKLLAGDASTNKQIFTFIYHNIFLSIDAMAGHLDIMGEMYSEFLKYALGDGKEIGIVLTPPYITKMMATILNVNQNSKVMDLATGSAGFLISAMELMIQDAEFTHGKQTTAANEQIESIKKQQLLGVELNAEMFTLAATNMILRGDGSAKIEKGSAFNRPEDLYTKFNANKILLNPPFSFKENGMPFISFGLDKMEKGGLGAIIIQDSAGSGKAINTNKALLNTHTLLASIKMPVDLFQPMAGVQTSIYIFEAYEPHDFDKIVKFIDFRSDGYKRTSRALQEINEPAKRYADIIKLYKAGKVAKLDAAWSVDDIYVEDFIDESGSDWNFEQHKVVDSKPTFDECRRSITDYFAWELEKAVHSDDSSLRGAMQKDMAALEVDLSIEWKEYRLEYIFEILTTKKKFNALDVEFGGLYPYVARGESNNGIRGYITEDTKYLNESNTISFGQDTATMFYQEAPYFTGDKIKVFKPKKNIRLNKDIAQMMIASMKKAFSSFSWGSSSFNVAILKEIKVTLPTREGTLDFDYMEKFVLMQKEERLEQIKSFLGINSVG